MRVKTSNRNRAPGELIGYGLIALLVFSPLPAGSVHKWSILVIELAALGLAAAYLLMGKKPAINESLGSALRWPSRFFAGFFVFLMVQILPLPVFLVKWISPNAWSSYAMYAVEPGRAHFLSLSLIPSYSFERTLELTAYFLVGYVIIQTVTRRRQIQGLFAALIAVGSFEALYGLFELYNENPRILFYEKVHNLDSVTGTFVNRNHLSGYLEMIIPLAIGLLIARMDIFSRRELGWRDRLLRISGKRGMTNLLLLLAIIVMSLAIVFSKSRSGVFILLLTFILFFGLTAVYFGFHGAKGLRTRKAVVAAFLSILGISLYIGIDSVLRRFSVDYLMQEDRPTYWANALKTSARFPLTGTGLGTYGALVPPMAGSEGPVALVHAHNDYLEYLSELGLIGSVLLLGGVLFCAVGSLNILRSSSHPEVKGLGMGAMISLCSIMVHSLTDFNLQIPANTLLFSAVVSLTMVISFYKKPAAAGDRH